MVFLARVLIFAICFGAFLGTASAQLTPLSQSVLQITLTPENPGPNEPVFARVDSYNFDLDTTEVIWYLNGIVQKRGTGVRQINFTAPGLGKTIALKVVAQHKTLGDLEQSLSLRTGDVEIIWEALGYTPPFYKGKTLHTYGGLVRYTAVPRLTDKNGTDIPASNLVYTWKKNSKVIQDQSGFGKSSVVVSDDSYVRDGNEISVEVSTQDHTASATGYIEVSPEVSKIAVYEKDPALGIRYENALGTSVNIFGDEIELVVEPYFFSVFNRDAGQIEYEWLLNDRPLTENGGKSSVTLRTPSGASGRAALSLIAQNQRQILQGGKFFSTVYFGN